MQYNKPLVNGFVGVTKLGLCAVFVFGGCDKYTNLGDLPGDWEHDDGKGGAPWVTPPGKAGNSSLGGKSGQGGRTSGHAGSPATGGTPVSSGGAESPPEAGTGGASGELGGSAGLGGVSSGEDAGSAGAVGAEAGAGGANDGVYAPRSGRFAMLVYTLTRGYRHEDSIRTGVAMLEAISKEYDFDITLAPDPSVTTPSDLSKYEIVFFMNTTGDIFNSAQERAFEGWMTKGGAFAGVHSATDTEAEWAFYKEVTGQYYDLHDPCCEAASIEWEPTASDFPGVKGLPSPWLRAEEWYYFNQAPVWSQKPGFKILSTVTTKGKTRPVSFVREWSNFRSFYTSLGHEAQTFTDPNVRKHIAAGILWAVRREHWLP